MAEPSKSGPLVQSVAWLDTKFSNFEQNRQVFQAKCDRNHRAFIREEADETWKKGEGSTWRSRTYLGKTREKVMSAAAMVMDTILQGGQIPYAYKASPWQPYATDPNAPTNIEADLLEMTKLTNQQLVDTHADRQIMKHVLSQALYGITWAKKIVHTVKRNGWRKQTITVDGIYDYSRNPSATTWSKWDSKVTSPGWVYVPVWDIFPDMEFPDNVQDSSGIFHRQIVSPHWLMSKIGRPFFIDDNLRAAVSTSMSTNVGGTPYLSGSTDYASLAPMLRDVKFRDNMLTYKEFWGRIPRSLAEEIEASIASMNPIDGAPPAPPTPDNYLPGDEVEVMACTVGGYLVRYSRQDPDSRPFAFAKCEDNIEENTPWGIADNCEPLQLVVNGAMRSFEDNKKLSANVITALKRRYIKGKMPEDITPGMKLELSEDCDDARKAIQSIVIPDVGESLVSLLTMAMPMLDDASMVPRLAQGYTDPNVQTATEVSVRQAQASKYMGMLIRNLDEGIIEPMVQYFYEFNMGDDAVQAGKGNYIVQGLGFSAFQNKVERRKMLQEMLALALSSPELMRRTNFDNLYRDLIKAIDLDPDLILLGPDQQQPLPGEQPPEIPPEQQAQMQAETQLTQAEAMEQQTAAELNKAKTAFTMKQALEEPEDDTEDSESPSENAQS